MCLWKHLSVDGISDCFSLLKFELFTIFVFKLLWRMVPYLLRESAAMTFTITNTLSDNIEGHRIFLLALPEMFFFIGNYLKTFPSDLRLSLRTLQPLHQLKLGVWHAGRAWFWCNRPIGSVHFLCPNALSQPWPHATNNPNPPTHTIDKPSSLGLCIPLHFISEKLIFSPTSFQICPAEHRKSMYLSMFKLFSGSLLFPSAFRVGSDIVQVQGLCLINLQIKLAHL